MEANTLPLTEFLGATKRIFNIPVYQRNYNWKQEQCKKLFDDILNIKIQNKDIHFIGTIVYVDIKAGPSFKEFVIIDGQQRITTMLLLIKALHDETEDEDLKLDLYNDYLINNSKRIDDKYRIKLKTVANDSKTFADLISNENLAVEDYKGSRIYENYNYFRNRIKESKLSSEELYELIGKLTMVYIMLDNEKEDPQLIFESLNSTGLDLTAGDLIRNYLLMGYDRETQEKLYAEYWEKLENKIMLSEITDFIRYYLTLKTNNIPNKTRVYEVFKEFYKKELKLGKKIEEILENINLYAKYYEWIKKFNSPFDKINSSLEEFEKLNSSVVIPFLFYLFYKFEENIIKEEDVIYLLEVIKSYIVRRAVCNIQTNALNKIFANLSKEIEVREDFEEFFKESILGILLSKTTTGIFPRDSQFKESFIKRDMYSFKLHKYILSKIIIDNEKERVKFENLTTEHIMPQKLNSKWKVDLGHKYEEIHEKNLHTIGNLTLTGYNSEISNKTFDEKKVLYENSNIKITRELIKYNKWDEGTILKRGKELSELAAKIWKIPEIEARFVNLKNIDYKNEFEIDEELNATGRKPIEINIIGQTFSINSWKEFFIKICESMCSLDEEKFEVFTTHLDFVGKEKRIISKSKDGLRVPEKIKSNIYIETNLNANDILNYSRIIIEKYNNDDINVSYKLKPLQ